MFALNVEKSAYFIFSEAVIHLKIICSVLLSDGQSGAAMRRDMRETEENNLLNSQVLETGVTYPKTVYQL